MTTDPPRRNEIPSDHSIAEFWRWFNSIASKLGADFENQELLAELDKWVSELGDVSWEIGPGLQEKNALVITPDGSREWLATTHRIVASGPAIPTWELHWARPPKQWDMQFSLSSESGRIVGIDARPWRYVLRRFPDNTFDIVVEQNSLHDVEGDDRYTAATILLDGILGERKRLKLIDRIEPVERLSNDDSTESSSIQDLSAHLDLLLPPSWSLT